MTRYTICTFQNFTTYRTAWIEVEFETNIFYVVFGIKGESFTRRHFNDFNDAKSLLSVLTKKYDMEDITNED